MQENDSPICPPLRGRKLRGAGVAYLCVGFAFIAVAAFGRQVAFTGVGCAFVGLGIAFIARSRRRP